MGYYATLEYEIIGDTKINLDKKEELENLFSLENPDSLDDVEGFGNVKLIVNGDKLENIELEEYYAKFYDDEIFIQNLKDVIISGGVRLLFTGEDGAKWGFLITPGKVSELCIIAVTAEQYEKIKDYLD